MDNKDFDEVEDIFGTDIEENYDVPVFNPESNGENKSVEIPSVDEVKTEEVPVYEDVLSSNSNTDVVDNVAEETDDSKIYNVQSDVVENNTQTDIFDVQPETVQQDNNDVKPVDPEPTYEDVNPENSEVSYGPVMPEVAYDEDVNEHPDAVVSLNNEEEVKEDVKLEDVPPVNLKDNQSLKFVFIIGIIILVAIFLLPFIDKFAI